MKDVFIPLKNGGNIPFEKVPLLTEDEFRNGVSELIGSSCRVMAFFALPEQDNSFRLVAVMGDPVNQQMLLGSFAAKERYRSLTPEFAAFHLFEREIAEDSGVIPEGHPSLHPVRKYSGEDTVAVNDFLRMKGEASHEVAVGPIHAGVIEPGHFRFQCMGEDVYSLEIALGYQHRGIEKLLTSAPDKLALHRIESAAGDTSIASAILYSTLVESLSGCSVPESVCQIRQCALELERIANHTGDLGALAGDVAFLSTASFCGRIRGEYLNMSAELCGNRFGRNLVVPGSCRYPLEKSRAEKLDKWINRIYPELMQAVRLMFNSPSVLDRFENTGSVSVKMADELGLVGVAARASGLAVDSRADFPLPGYDLPLPQMAEMHGDVMARAMVRGLEIESSHRWLMDFLPSVEADLDVPEELTPAMAPNSIAVSVIEAWRGELCHVAVTGENNSFRKYKIVDPSFHNWSGLAMALRGEQISNFPICNKSFNLSYCGHDL